MRRSRFLILCVLGLGLPCLESAHAAEPISEKEAEAFLEKWATTQNRGEFASYSELYAADFAGVRRSGKSTARMDRAAWLTDRERMFRAPMKVETDASKIQATADSATITFVQTWSTEKFADLGTKSMTVRRGPKGLQIVAEDMLCSLVSVRNGRKVVFTKQKDVDDVGKAVPTAQVQMLPDKEDPNCPVDRVWRIEVSQRTGIDVGGAHYGILLWNEQNKPGADNNYDMNFSGGVAVLRDGKRIWASDDSGCHADRPFSIPDGFVLPLQCSSGYHGEASTDLLLYRVSGDRVTKAGSEPIEANDSADSDTYSYKAQVEYRDVDGNGTTDVVVTPTERRNLKAVPDRKFPKAAKIIKF